MNRPFLDSSPSQLPRLGIVLAAGLLLSGCQHLSSLTQPSSATAVSSSSTDSSSARVPEAVDLFLSEAPADQKRVFEQSPWGSPASITAQSTYYAASGRECRTLTIDSPSANRAPGLACRAADGWEWVRPVTR